MKIEEVEEWAKTEAGAKWLEEKKRPLTEKRDQLLNELADMKKRLADATEQGNALDGKLKGYLENLTNAHVLNILDGKVVKKDGKGNLPDVLPDAELREFVRGKIEKLAELDGGLIAGIDDSGAFTLATKDGKGFADYYEEWTGTDAAKSFLANHCTGGGARGYLRGELSGITANAVKSMSPVEVASKLNDPAFRNGLQSLN